MQLHKGSILGRILFGKNVNDDAVVIRTGTTKFCVNWSENLQYMWQEKLKRYPNNKAVNDFYNEVVLKWKPEYKNRNFDAFYTTNNDIIHDMHGQINWQNIEQELSPSKTKILRMILGEMNFDSILAYGLTELFEERPGAVNLEAFKAIYNSAGIEYINLIPAQFDKYLSFGLWQFTSLAVGPES